jgi:hypothetical protein
MHGTRTSLREHPAEVDLARPSVALFEIGVHNNLACTVTPGKYDYCVFERVLRLRDFRGFINGGNRPIFGVNILLVRPRLQ